jgi:glutaredoxin 2
MAALPVLKLFFLGVKQLSKPVAGFIKNRAKSNPSFKQHVINSAQLWHRINVRASQVANNASADARALRIKPLDEATAVSTFTDILGETVIYVIAAVALVIEYQMSAEKDAKKAIALELRFKNAEDALQKQKAESEALRNELKHSQRLLVSISQDVLELQQVRCLVLSAFI